MYQTIIHTGVLLFSPDIHSHVWIMRLP